MRRSTGISQNFFPWQWSSKSYKTVGCSESSQPCTISTCEMSLLLQELDVESPIPNVSKLVARPYLQAI